MGETKDFYDFGLSARIPFAGCCSDRAIEYLNRGYQDQSVMLLYLQLYGIGGIDKDPRFPDLQRRVKGN